MLEFVAAAFGVATESAFPDLRLSASRSDPRVAPGAEHTGGNGRGGGFGDVDGFFELVVQDGLSNAGLISVSEESADSRANSIGKVVGEEGGFEPFRSGRLCRSFFFGGALENRAPSGVWHRLACFIGIVSKSGLGPPAVVFFSWLVGTAGEAGHWAFFVSSFLEVGPFWFPGAGDFGRPYQCSAWAYRQGVMFLIPISCW